MKTDKREALSKMVGLTVDEQRLCRIEGFKMALRMLPPGKYVEAMSDEARRRWGEAFDA